MNDYAKIERQNNVFIKVFVYEDATPYHIYTSKETFKKDVDLLLLLNSKNIQILTTDFTRFMTHKTRRHDKELFC